MKTMTNKMEGGRIGWMTAKEPTMSQEALADYEMQKQACMEVNKLNDDFEYIDYPTKPKEEPMVSVCLSHLRELTPLSENVGRIGYFQTAKERKEPAFTVGKYEDIKKVWAQTC